MIGQICKKIKIYTISLVVVPSLLLGGVDVSPVTIEVDPIKQTLDVNLPKVYILPDSPVYQVKLMWEQIRIFLSRTPEQQMALFMHLATIRLSETLAMLEEEKLDLAKTSYGKYIELINRTEYLWTQTASGSQGISGQLDAVDTEDVLLQTKFSLQRETKKLAELLMGEYKMEWTR